MQPRPTSPPLIYLAGPLFTQAEVQFNTNVAIQLNAAGYRVYLPQQECAGLSDAAAIFRRCLAGIEAADLLLVNLDGSDSDSGSCFEMGYAYHRGIPIVGYRTDFRGSGEHMGLNIMLAESCEFLFLASLAPAAATAKVSYFPFGEDVVPLILAWLNARTWRESEC